MNNVPTEGVSMPLILIAAGLLLLFGVIAIGALMIVARRCNKGKSGASQKNTHIEQIDAWEEAGKRVKGDFNEPE